MNLLFVTLLIYTITINLRYTTTRAVLPRDYHSSFQLSSANHERKNKMNGFFIFSNPGTTISFMVSKDSAAQNSVPSLGNSENGERFQGKALVPSSMNFSIRFEDENIDNNLVLVPITLALESDYSDGSEIPTISNSAIKRSAITDNDRPEDASRNDSGFLISRLSGNNYLITLVSQNISDEGEHARPVNWTVLMIARHISSPETLNLAWVVIGIIALTFVLLAGIFPLILACCDYIVGGRDNEQKMMVDLITPFSHQEYPTEITKVDTGSRDRSGKARMSKHLELKHGDLVGNPKQTKTHSKFDQDGDTISLDDFKICQARKMINLQPFRPAGHDYNVKNSSEEIGSLVSPTASTSTSSFTVNNPISPLTTITSPTSFQSLAFSDYHSPLPSLPKKCITT